MKEKPSGGESTIPKSEVKKIITKRLGEGVSTGWEGERIFTAEEIMAVIKELVDKAGDLEVTDQLVSHEGVLLSVSVRAPGSATGYSYMIKGNHGGSFRKRTIIDRIDYAGPDSELVDFVDGEILEYKDGDWVK